MAASESPPAHDPLRPIAPAVRGGVRAVGAELLDRGLPVCAFGPLECTIDLITWPPAILPECPRAPGVRGGARNVSEIGISVHKLRRYFVLALFLGVCVVAHLYVERLFGTVGELVLAAVVLGAGIALIHLRRQTEWW